MFLCWFHNHGGRFIGEMGAAGRRGRSPYDDRNPAWLMSGWEIDTPSGREIEWSEPEILLYDDDPYVRISYPELIEENGSFFITETQKNRGRVHEIPPRLLDGLLGQWEARKAAERGLILDVPRTDPAASAPPLPVMPPLPPLNRRDGSQPDHGLLDLRAGFSLELWLELDSTTAGQVLLDTRTSDGKGILVATVAARAVAIDGSIPLAATSTASGIGVEQQASMSRRSSFPLASAAVCRTTRTSSFESPRHTTRTAREWSLTTHSIRSGTSVGGWSLGLAIGSSAQWKSATSTMHVRRKRTSSMIQARARLASVEAAAGSQVRRPSLRRSSSAEDSSSTSGITKAGRSAVAGRMQSWARITPGRGCSIRPMVSGSPVPSCHSRSMAVRWLAEWR